MEGSRFVLAKDVMVDPSVLVSPSALEDFLDQAAEWWEEGHEIYLPRAFAALLERNSPEGLLENAAYRYFNPGWRLADPAFLLDRWDRILALTRLSPPSAVPSAWEEPLQFHRNEVVDSVISEEWQFLMTRSAVMSRYRRSFAAMIRRGAVAVEFGAAYVDRAIRKSLKKPETEILSRVDRYRAVGKWIAVSGPSVAALIEPITAAVGGAAAGVFLLLDPNTRRVGHGVFDKRLTPRAESGRS